MERTGLKNIEDLDLETLMGLAETRAAKEQDGHLTFMRFTTGWKVGLGTPDLRSGAGCEEVENMECHKSLKEAVVSLLLQRGSSKGSCSNRFRGSSLEALWAVISAR